MYRRIQQVCQYGWCHAMQIAQKHHLGFLGRIVVFLDILYCYFTYKMWSNQYLHEDFYFRSKEERRVIGSDYLQKGIRRDRWQKRFQEDKRLYAKYGTAKYEVGYKRREERTNAYRTRYGAGEGFFVENNVQLCQQHYLDGSIKIGKNVLLAKNVFIDYSGNVVLKDGVILTNGVIIETHYHTNHSNWKVLEQDVAVPTSLVIEQNAVIGSRAIIMPTCCYIGKYTRVGAGAVVTKDVPDYATVVGVPAKVIKINNPDK